MTDEVSVSFHISILVMCTAALLSTVIGISTMSLNIMRNYSDRYNQAIGSATESGVYTLAQNGEAPMPVIYSTLLEGVNTIDRVRVNDGATSTVIYEYNNINIQNLTILLSKYRTNNGRITISAGELNRSLVTVNVEVIR